MIRYPQFLNEEIGIEKRCAVRFDRRLSHSVLKCTNASLIVLSSGNEWPAIASRSKKGIEFRDAVSFRAVEHGKAFAQEVHATRRNNLGGVTRCHARRAHHVCRMQLGLSASVKISAVRWHAEALAADLGSRFRVYGGVCLFGM